VIRLNCILARGDHAARCPRCRRAAAQDRALRALADAAPVPALPPRARDDAFAAAFARPVVAPPPRWPRIAIPAGLALATAAVIAIVVVRGLGAPGRRPGREPVAIAAGTPVAVAHAQVTLAAGGMAWRTGDAEVLLIAGRIDVDVDPAPNHAFRVRTPAFAVDVIGTVFTVDLDGVVVARGAVRVSTPDGVVVVERLAAGERWRREAEVEAAVNVPELELTPEEVLAMGDTPPDPPPTVRGKKKPSTPMPPSDDEQLEVARNQLLAGEIAACRETIRTLLASSPPRSIRASAEMLVAQSHVKGGDRDTAVTLYRGIADKYRDLTGTGDAALFQAARLELAAGHAGEARALYELYLERFPNGPLADKARDALGKAEPR
jgi:hypothetical protein